MGAIYGQHSAKEDWKMAQWERNTRVEIGEVKPIHNTSSPEPSLSPLKSDFDIPHIFAGWHLNPFPGMKHYIRQHRSHWMAEIILRIATNQLTTSLPRYPAPKTLARCNSEQKVSPSTGRGTSLQSPASSSASRSLRGPWMKIQNLFTSLPPIPWAVNHHPKRFYRVSGRDLAE